MTQPTQPTPVDRQEKVVVRDYGTYEHKTHTVENLDAQRRATVSRIAQIIWLLFGVLEALIGLRVVLKLMAANPANPFANLIYSFTDVFLKPFVGLTVTPEAQGVVFEIPAIIAIFAYALVGWVVVRLVWLLFYQPTARSIRTVEEDHDRTPDI